MPKKKDSVSVKPKDGGALMTRPSADEAGLANYTWKQDWRRDLDQESRREGHDYFRPNAVADLGNQPYPQSQPLRGQPVTVDPDTDTIAMTGVVLFNVPDGTEVRFSAGTMPAPLVSGTIYFVVSATSANFKVAATSGGAAINLTTAGAGVRMDTVDPATPIAPEAINLVHLARRPNGQTAVIVGTATTLYRFVALEETAYFETAGDTAYFEGTGSEAYYEEGGAGTGDDYMEGGGAQNTTYFETTGEGTPYFEEETGAWQVIGSGFSRNGKRWEAVNINGYAVFNNGYDLPVTFRIEESAVVPIYELRESGVAFVGTIAETNGILVCGDIAQMTEEALEESLSHTDSGDIQASQAGSLFSSPFTATAEASEQGGSLAEFDIWHEGAPVLSLGATGDFANWLEGAPVVEPANEGIAAVTVVRMSSLAAAAGGLTRVGAVATFRTVTAHRFTSGQQVNVSGANEPEYNGDFTITVTDFDKFTYTVTGTPPTPDIGTPLARRAFFDASMVGLTIEFLNGLSGEIISFVDTTTIRVEAPVESLVGFHYLFYIIDPATDYQVVSDQNFFTPEMVGQSLFWDSGEERLIVAYVSPTEVRVDRHQTILNGRFQLENTEGYAAFTNAAKYDRIQYRLLWSALENPRRFNAAVPGSIEAGSRQLTLQYPSRSFEIGQTIVITGADISGSNLEADIVWIAADRRRITLDMVALTSVTEALVSADDAIGSIVGYDDLQDDSSGILKMLELNGTLVVYKDTSIFLTAYTGLPEAPFKSRKIYNEGGEHSGRTPFYRHTLISVNGDFHLYAGRNSLYRFDLSSQMPKEFKLAENLSDLFYSQATLANVEKIFTGNNSLTKEIFLCFPSASAVKAICLDYFTNSASTTGAEYTALATIKRPVEGIALGVIEDWCVCGDALGRILLYGRADVPQDLWDGAEAIFHRLGQGYESRLRSGLYGNRYNESDLTGYLLELSTQANPNLAEITLNIYGYRNLAETATLVDTITMPMAAFENLVPMFYREHYFQDELVVSGQNNPCRIACKTVEMGGVRSRSVIRRVQ